GQAIEGLVVGHVDVEALVRFVAIWNVELVARRHFGEARQANCCLDIGVGARVDRSLIRQFSERHERDSLDVAAGGRPAFFATIYDDIYGINQSDRPSQAFDHRESQYRTQPVGKEPQPWPSVKSLRPVGSRPRNSQRGRREKSASTPVALVGPMRVRSNTDVA